MPLTHKFSLLTVEEMVKALRDKQIPTEEDCLLLADRLDRLIAYRKFAYETEQARHWLPKDF